MLDIDMRDMDSVQMSALRAQAFRSLGHDSRHWFKVHDCFATDLFPPDLTAGVVYIVRDPRDVAPSWADHMNVDLDTAISQMCETGYTLARAGIRYNEQAQQMFGSWAQNVQSWLDAPPRPLLLLRYEDLLADPVTHCTRRRTFSAAGWIRGHRGNNQSLCVRGVASR